MGKKIGLGVGAVILLFVIWFGVVAAGMGGEASKAHDMLEAAQKTATQQELDQKLKDLGFTVTDSPNQIDAVGPNHGVLFYSSQLTVKATFGEDGKCNSYHLDKQ